MNNEIVNETVHKFLEKIFKEANIPMMKINTIKIDEHCYRVYPIFYSANYDKEDEIFIDLKVIDNKVLAVASVGSVEIFVDHDLDFVLESFAGQIFKILALEASRLISAKSGKNCDIDHLRVKKSGELLNWKYISYNDFKYLDLKKVDWSKIY